VLSFGIITASGRKLPISAVTHSFVSRLRTIPSSGGMSSVEEVSDTGSCEIGVWSSVFSKVTSSIGVSLALSPHPHKDKEADKARAAKRNDFFIEINNLTFKYKISIYYITMNGIRHEKMVNSMNKGKLSFKFIEPLCKKVYNKES